MPSSGSNIFGELLNYVHLRGHARVPRSNTTLGAWVVDQRNRFARGMLDPHRSARLKELTGWTWGPRAARPQAKTTTRHRKRHEERSHQEEVDV